MCPLMRALAGQPGAEGMICMLGREQAAITQVLNTFGCAADFVAAMSHAQGLLTDAAREAMEAVTAIYTQVRPDVVLLFGDTVAAVMAGLAAYYLRIPVVLVGTCMRASRPDSVFPEEMNRRLLRQLAKLHFVATRTDAENLAREGIVQGVHIVGSTSADALLFTVEEQYIFDNSALWMLDLPGSFVLVTVRRRENWVRPLKNICEAIIALADKHPKLKFVFSVDANPLVSDIVHGSLGGHPQVLLTDPLGVRDMHNVLSRSKLVMTDSDGLLEEAPFLDVPALILRNETERTEAVQAGCAVLAGTQRDGIIQAADAILSDRLTHIAMRKAQSPYGDGHASERIAGLLVKAFT